MSPDIVCAGEMLVEIMRDRPGITHAEQGLYRGPFASGAPAIFIDSAARMGAPVNMSTGFIGVTGKDAFGNVIISKLERDGVDASQVRVDPDHATGVAFVQYNEDGSRKFIFSKGAAGLLHPDDIKTTFMKDTKVFHVMGSALSISTSSKNAVLKAVDLTLNAGGFISFDPNLRVEMMPLDEILDTCKPVIEKTRVLLPSGEEASMLTGDDDPMMACETLLQEGPEIIVLKQGKDGCTVFTSEGTTRVPGFSVEETDPTGAGDTFGGAFIVELLQGVPPVDGARFANAAGALKVTHFGPMSDDARDDVLSML
ncbi:sugar kinase [Candidatus Bathyarchaeota archaeon]|nr:sugar kinase [Candidatus Bathyarchaeota archaeon]